MEALTHSAEPFTLTIRWLTLAVVLWEGWSSMLDWRELRGTGDRAILVARWRIAHTVFSAVLAATWIRSMVVVLDAPYHDETTHSLMFYQNLMVAFLLIKTLYLRYVRMSQYPREVPA